MFEDLMKQTKFYYSDDEEISEQLKAPQISSTGNAEWTKITSTTTGLPQNVQIGNNVKILSSSSGIKITYTLTEQLAQDYKTHKKVALGEMELDREKPPTPKEKMKEDRADFETQMKIAQTRAKKRMALKKIEEKCRKLYDEDNFSVEKALGTIVKTIVDIIFDENLKHEIHDHQPQESLD